MEQHLESPSKSTLQILRTQNQSLSGLHECYIFHIFLEVKTR